MVTRRHPRCSSPSSSSWDRCWLCELLRGFQNGLDAQVQLNAMEQIESEWRRRLPLFDSVRCERQAAVDLEVDEDGSDESPRVSKPSTLYHPPR